MNPPLVLNPPGKNVLAHLLARLDAAMLIATHDIAFATRLCTRSSCLKVARGVSTARNTAEMLRVGNTRYPTGPAHGNMHGHTLKFASPQLALAPVDG